MKKMKKLAAVLLAVSMVCQIIGCAGKNNTDASQEAQQKEEQSTSQEITVNLHYLRSDDNYGSGQMVMEVPMNSTKKQRMRKEW